MTDALKDALNRALTDYEARNRKAIEDKGKRHASAVRRQGAFAPFRDTVIVPVLKETLDMLQSRGMMATLDGEGTIELVFAFADPKNKRWKASLPVLIQVAAGSDDRNVSVRHAFFDIDRTRTYAMGELTRKSFADLVARLVQLALANAPTNRPASRSLARAGHPRR